MTEPKRPRPLPLPVSLSTSQVLANLKTAEQISAQRRGSPMKINLAALKPAEALDRAPTTKAEREMAVRQASYRDADITPSKVDLTKEVPGMSLMEVDDIDPYDGDPRVFGNEAEEDIENNLRANGFLDALVVTRRNPAERYMLAAGSNTTLRILKRLWTETKDQKYRFVNVVIQPYEHEAKLLAQHLGENLARGQMKFWEVALGMVRLLDTVQGRRTAETPAAKPMSMREQADELTRRGLRATKTDVSIWRFAVTRLASLGPALSELTFSAVQDHVQPRLNALGILALKFKVEEVIYWDEIVAPCLARYAADFEHLAEGASFDPSALCDAVEASFAEFVVEPAASIRQMLSLLKKAPSLTLADLRAPSPNLLAGSTVRPEAIEEDDAARNVSATATETPTPQQQAPLALGPGQVRGVGATPPVPVSAPRVSNAAGTNAPSSAPPAAQPSVHGALFEQATSETDPLRRLHQGVEQLLQLVGMTDVLRWHDEMPMGFFIELPDRALHARRKVTLGSPEFEARKVKTLVWWTLVGMNCQFRDACVPFMDHQSAFYRHFSAESEDDPFEGTDIDNQPFGDDDMLIFRMSPGPGLMREAWKQLRNVEELAARLFEEQPERWRRMLEAQRKNH